ncbi:MAG: hypothetical protein IPN01_14035 [Deltaproteobacteria bacterium]|nr:hypothetical protein [Deltaproteobacteria bacterium]
MRALVHNGWEYTLFEDGDRLILSVPSGGVAVFEVNVVLTDEEAAAFRAQGIEGLQGLIRQMRLSPRSFQSRQIELPRSA